MSFLEDLQKNTNKGIRTENGAVTNESTLDFNLDFFSLAGAMRDRPEAALDLFNKAFAQDQLIAIKTLFYLRDIRGGQGERAIFRYILNSLDPKTLNKIVQYIPDYGRWDEVPLNDAGLEMIKYQLKDDARAYEDGKSVSLLAKWLPSENASSKTSRDNARKIAKYIGIKPSLYRKDTATLRGYIKILEQKMSSNEWDEIEYGKLPSQAHRKHIKAFKRHSEERYDNYLTKVEKGEEKINSNTSFTYEIFEMVCGGGYYNPKPEATVIRAADAMWKSLPDYTRGDNALVLADVSGSMTGRPMATSVSLATYFAERNTGTFHDYYVTFTDRPRVQQVIGSNIYEKFDFVMKSGVGYNTDLQAAFTAILDTATKSNTPQEEMPKVLYIISDMEFDAQMSNCGETNFETAKRNFEANGYELPHVVFWNVNARQNQAPATKFDDKVTLISGSSQSTFQYAVAGKTPTESMLDILNSKRYQQIEL